MKPVDVPFNIDILQTTNDVLRGLRKTAVLDTTDGSSGDFHPDGLYSALTFGPVGDERRNARFSYIDIKIEIFHPVVYNTLISMKRLYAEIISGKKYAKWDKESLDFVASNAIEGNTGFHFFLTHWKDINHRRSSSISREQGIQLLDKYKDKCMTSKIVVLPAGLRDMEVDDSGRRTEDEVNPVYRKLIALSNIINEATARNNPEILDTSRYQLQLTFNRIYDHFNQMIEGKKKLFLGRFASRRIFNGTRNVISAMDTTVPVLGEKGNPGFNSTIIGLYQFLKANLPISIYQIRKQLENTFMDVNRPTLLVNQETLESEEVMLSARDFDLWTTNDGVESLLTRFSEESIRDKPLVVGRHYLSLIYKGPDATFRLMKSIKELPEGRSAEHVHPLTFVELLYLCVYKTANSFPIYVTRYPITGVGSIYPSMVHLRVTTMFEKRRELGDNWQPLGDDTVAHEYPIVGSSYVNSLIPHPSKLAKLGAD
jgi:hypothetical protein